MELHQKLRHYRKVADVSQQVIGEACNPPITRAAVGRWEHPDPKKRSTPSEKQLKVFAEITKTPLNMLVEERTEVAQGWDVSVEDKKDDLIEMIDLFRALSEDDKALIISTARRLTQ